MRYLIQALFAVIVFAGCSKRDASLEATTVVSSDALQPLKYHSTSFKTDYSPTGFQPFSFSKELYPDTRVKRAQMRSRAFINHPSVDTKNYYYDFDYQFAYSTNKSIITRTYKFSGSPAFLGPEKFECLFNANGHCTSIKRISSTDPNSNPADTSRLRLYYSGKKLTRLFVPFSMEEPGSGTHGEFAVETDANGNVLSIKSTDEGDPFRRYPNVFYTYNYGKTGNYCYMPTQYVFSQWFTLLEAMQWVPMQVNERKTVRLVVNYTDWSGGTEDPKDAVIAQGQNYLNHKYDANGNLISYTYGDGVAQRITWK